MARASSGPDDARSDAGDTLIEVLIALVIISIAVTGLMGALLTSITTSGEHRSLSVEDTLLRSYAEAYENQIQFQSAPDFRECATESDYAKSLTPPSTPSGYTVGFTVQYGTASGSSFDQTCGANDKTGVQLITLNAQGPGATQTLAFVVRNPNDTRRLGSHQRGEEGATLLLALIFVLLVSVIMLAIVNLSGTNILNTTNLQNERTLEYSAEGGVQAALQAVRYSTPTATTTYCSHTPAYLPPAPISGAVVYCQVGTLIYARALTFEACPTGTVATACTSNLNNADVLRATVLFNDVSVACSSPIGTGCYSPMGAVAGSTSGASVTVESWIVERANG